MISANQGRDLQRIDAAGHEEAKRCAESAFRALIDLNNTLSQDA